MNLETLEPLSQYIVVKKDAENEMTAGGLHIPEVSRDVPRTGIVKAVGPGFYNEEGTWFPNELKVGQRVMFKAFGGWEVDLNGEKFQIFQEYEILGIIEGDAPIRVERGNPQLPHGTQMQNAWGMG